MNIDQERVVRKRRFDNLKRKSADKQCSSTLTI